MSLSTFAIVLIVIAVLAADFWIGYLIGVYKGYDVAVLKFRPHLIAAGIDPTKV